MRRARRMFRSAAKRSGRCWTSSWPNMARVRRSYRVIRRSVGRTSSLQLHAEVERCARGLLALGVARGHRVGIWSPNNVEWVVVQFATAKVGAVLVNINPSYRRHELEYALRQSGCSVVILAPGFRDADYVELLEGVDAPALRKRVVLGEGWRELLARGDEVAVDDLRAREEELDFDQPINIQYTSG